MMIARWRIDARFGHKDQALRMLKQWNEQFGQKIGWSANKVRTTTGAIGVAESAIFSEVEVKDLAELSASLEKLSKLDGHAAWGRELEPHVVSGTNQWEIYRVV